MAVERNYYSNFELSEMTVTKYIDIYYQSLISFPNIHFKQLQITRVRLQRWDRIMHLSIDNKNRSIRYSFSNIYYTSFPTTILKNSSVAPIAPDRLSSSTRIDRSPPPGRRVQEAETEKIGPLLRHLAKAATLQLARQSRRSCGLLMFASGR